LELHGAARRGKVQRLSLHHKHHLSANELSAVSTRVPESTRVPVSTRVPEITRKYPSTREYPSTHECQRVIAPATSLSSVVTRRATAVVRLIDVRHILSRS
jgi:hypothetical protein